MEALLLITLVMIAVDGPVTPIEVSKDINVEILNHSSSSQSSAWTGGPKENMWTANQRSD